MPCPADRRWPASACARGLTSSMPPSAPTRAAWVPKLSHVHGPWLLAPGGLPSCCSQATGTSTGLGFRPCDSCLPSCVHQSLIERVPLKGPWPEVRGRQRQRDTALQSLRHHLPAAARGQQVAHDLPREDQRRQGQPPGQVQREHAHPPGGPKLAEPRPS